MSITNEKCENCDRPYLEVKTLVTYKGKDYCLDCIYGVQADDTEPDEFEVEECDADEFVTDGTVAGGTVTDGN